MNETDRQVRDARAAVVIVAIESVLAAPAIDACVVTQTTLGGNVTVLAATSPSPEGFAHIETVDGYRGWIPIRSLSVVADGGRPYAADDATTFVTTSIRAHLYREASFIKGKPIFTVPMGTRLERGAPAAPGEAFVQIILPRNTGIPGDRAYIAATDITTPAAALAPPRGPARWIALGMRLLDIPYTWGGTTPLGFDCSGLVQFLLKNDGIQIKRDAYEQCFQDSRLRPVDPAAIQPGDLLYFGTSVNINHVAMCTDAKAPVQVLEATRHGRPGTRISTLESPHLAGKLQYVRRVTDGAQKRSADAARLGAFKAHLDDLVHDSAGLHPSVYFKDLSTGESLAINESAPVYPASTFKTAVYLELLYRADRQTLSLDTTIPVRNQFKSVKDGSTFSIETDDEQDEAVLPHLGATMTLRDLGRAMMIRSSNLATNLLLEYLGPDAVSRRCAEIGAGETVIRRGIEDAPARESGLDNVTTARSLGRVIEACEHDVPGFEVSTATRNLLIQTLFDQKYHDGIPDGLHPQSGARVAHKSGLTSNTKHDSGFIQLPDGRRYVLVVLTHGFKESPGVDAARTFIHRVSRAALEHMIAP